MSDQGNEGLLSPFLKNARIRAAKKFIFSNDTILDIGCGSGDLAKLVNHNNYFGYDIDTYSLSLAKNKYPNHSFENTIPNKKFDKIIALAVIEHVKDPVEFLYNFKKYLNSDGMVILTTPHPSYEWIHDLGVKFGLFSSHASEEHETLINFNSMAKIANQAGYEIKTFRRFLMHANQLIVLKLKK